VPCAAEVRVPKAEWVRFRWSRPVPQGVKSYRVTRDQSGRWHVAFAIVPEPVPAPGNGEAVGVDRGVVVSAALSTGELLRCPALTPRERPRMRRLERKLARAKRGSGRRSRVKRAVARLKARECDRRKDWCEKTSTDLARRFDVIRVENLKITNMTASAKGTAEAPGRNVQQKAGLNRGILGSGWGLLVRRLEDEAPGRVEKISPAYTSQRCSACGHVAAGSRESQALFRCAACGNTLNADVNAARNIAAGHAVTARGGDEAARPVNREPQPVLLPAEQGPCWNPLPSGRGGCQCTSNLSAEILSKSVGGSGVRPSYLQGASWGASARGAPGTSHRPSRPGAPGWLPRMHRRPACRKGGPTARTSGT
jgi:putative transposase